LRKSELQRAENAQLGALDLLARQEVAAQPSRDAPLRLPFAEVTPQRRQSASQKIRTISCQGLNRAMRSNRFSPAEARMIQAVFRSAWTWIAVLLLFAASQMIHRTPPVKKDSFFFDFSNVYSASRTWLHGDNPYNIQDVYRAWDSSNHGKYLGSSIPANMATWCAVYPPSSLLIIAPFAALPAVPGHLLWFAFCIALLVATFAALFSLCDIDDTKSRLLLIASALASAPLQCAIEQTQPALPAASLVILAVWARSKDRATLAGVFLGAATAVKFQIGAPFILYYLFIRQWRLGAIAAILFAIAMLAAIGRMEALGIHTWWIDWQRNVALTLEPGGVNDPRPLGPFRNDMINLQTIVDVFVHQQVEIILCVMLIFLPLVISFVKCIRPQRAPGVDLLALSLVALLSMLPFYRRLYDSVLLLMLLAWAIARLRPSYQSGQRAMGILVLALLGEFLLPIDLVLFILHRSHRFDSSVPSIVWQGIVVPHHAWGLLAIAIGACYVFARQCKAEPAGVADKGAPIVPAISLPV
jgi:hypothetical protein